MKKRMVVVRLKQEKDIIFVRLSRKVEKKLYSQIAHMVQDEYKAKRVICQPRLARETECWLCEIDVDNANVSVISKVKV